MANELNNQFFADETITPEIKLGAIALALRGTCDLPKEIDGKSKVMTSLVCRKQKITPIVVDMKEPSLSLLACKACVKSLGLDNYFGNELGNLFNGTISDEEICDKLAESVRKDFNFNQVGMNDNFPIAREYLTRYLEACDIPANKKDTLVANLEKAYTQDKKKQLMQQSEKVG